MRTTCGVPFKLCCTADPVAHTRWRGGVQGSSVTTAARSEIEKKKKTIGIPRTSELSDLESKHIIIGRNRVTAKVPVVRQQNSPRNCGTNFSTAGEPRRSYERDPVFPVTRVRRRSVLLGRFCSLHEQLTARSKT